MPKITQQWTKEHENKFRANLAGVGINDTNLQDDFVVTNLDVKFEQTLITALAMESNVLILGNSGWGKTQIVNQIAKKLNMRCKPITISSKTAEDFGGRPGLMVSDVNEELLRKKAERELAKKQAEVELPDEIEKFKLKGIEVGSAQEERIRKQLVENILNSKQITEEEINELTEKYKNIPRTAKRKEEVYAAPDWVYEVIDNYDLTGKRTVIFLDEMNQGQADVLNSTFTFIDERKFANMPEYDMSEAMSVVAAGNFRSQNSALTAMPYPLVRRFQTKIYYIGRWEDSVAYLKSKYRHNRIVVDLLTYIGTNIDKQTGDLSQFSNPASLESSIRKLDKVIMDNIYVENASVIHNIRGNIYDRIQEIIDKNNLNDETRITGPREGQAKVNPITGEEIVGNREEGPLSKFAGATSRLIEKWGDFAEKGLIKGNRLYRWSIQKDKEDFIGELKLREEFKEVTQEYWTLLLSMDRELARSKAGGIIND